MKKILILTTLPIVFLTSSFSHAAEKTEAEIIAGLQAQIVELQKILNTLIEQKAQEKKRAATHPSQAQLSSTPNSYSDFTHILKIGLNDKLTNGEVKALQKLLIKDGYLDDIADGWYGAKTAAAVQKLNKSKGIEINKGEFDPRNFNDTQEKEGDFVALETVKKHSGSDQLNFHNISYPYKKENIISLKCSGEDKKYTFKKDQIIFPITFPYDASVKKVECILTSNHEGQEKEYKVLELFKKEIPRKVTHITLPPSQDKTYNNTSKEDTDRAIREAVMIKALYKEHKNDELKISSPFDTPTDSKVTGDFGTSRIFNGKTRSYHSGTDFKAATGDNLFAVNDGEIILAQDLFYCGNTVIINHGADIFSAYCHLSAITAEEGQDIKKGQKVGDAGATGRVTGPHLHLGIKYQGQHIDFLDMLERSQTLK